MTDAPNKLSRRIAWLIVTAVTVYVATIEIRNALPRTMGYDEAWHFYVAVVSPVWYSLLAMSADTHPPLYYPPLRALASIGSDPFWPRLLSVIPTILCVPLWYALLRKLRINLPTAVVATVVLGSAYSFLHMGVLIRAYAITGVILLVALWFWIDMLPGGTGRPRRLSSIMSLLMFTLAMGFLYAGAFATTAVFTATLLVMAVNGNARQSVWRNWRQHSRG